VVDGSQAYTIVTAPAVSADPAYTGRDAADVSVTNTDDDVLAVPVIAAAGSTIQAESCGAGNGAIDPDETVTVGSRPREQRHRLDRRTRGHAAARRAA
jgi:hypothetical protein